MYKILLRVPPTMYAFLSGLMISVATSAVAQVAFAESVASNRDYVISSGGVALLGGLFWFLLSENINTMSRKIEEITPVFRSRDTAIASLSRSSRTLAITYFILACCCSCLWPWMRVLK